MDKEEAIKILKNFHDKSALFSVRTALETLHPELKESEDERISKKIKKVLNWYRKSFSEKSLRNEEYDEMFAWLEKQGSEENKRNLGGISSNSAWSKEDEEMFEYTINLLNYNLGCRKWLKSLKERYFWKPKTWEIQILESVIEKGENPKNYSATLHSILEQLKKLKGK